MFKDTTNLRQGELLTIFCVLWLVGTVPHIGWSTYFAIWLAAPAYFANTENQWAEALFNDIPWHFLPATTDRVLTFLRTRCHWFPLHSVGVAFQNTIVGILYWFSLFLVWLAKFTLLHYGGVRAYVSAKPLFYGLGIGYVVGVIFSVTMDLIWFPTAGHFIHRG